MTANDLNVALNGIENRFLEETEIIRQKGMKRVKKSKIISAVAACLVISLTVGIAVIKRNKGLTISENLKPITISDEFGSMGMEAYEAYGISELVNSNPWNENTKLTTLPVFENRHAYDEYGNFDKPDSEDFKKMREVLLSVAEALGISEEKLNISDNTPEYDDILAATEKYSTAGKELPEDFTVPSTIIGKYNGLKLSVDQRFSCHVEIEKPIKLPSKYLAGHYMSYSEASETGKYILKKYKKYFNMKKPTLDIYGGDYDIYLRQLNNIGFYDSHGSITDKIINYSFNHTHIYFDDDGRLSGAWIDYNYTSGSIGNYPLISHKEAEKLLLNGKYTSSVPYEIKDKKYVKKVELIYRNTPWERYIIPYYRFYVELAEKTEILKKNKLNKYGIYYVPAIEGKFIKEK